MVRSTAIAMVSELSSSIARIATVQFTYYEEESRSFQLMTIPLMTAPSMTAVSEPVLVVGGRTTGLFMATELARHGVPVRIIDKSPGIDPHSRATYLRSRTLEILHGQDLADTIVAEGQSMHASSIYANGRHIVTTPELPVDSPFPWGKAYAQSKTEAILERHLDRIGIQVERETELLSLDQLPDHLNVRIRKGDGSEETLKTPWLIGCDGSHSVTRKLLGEPFPGADDPATYTICDVIAEGPLDPAVVYLCLHDEGDLFFFLLDEGRRQISATFPRDGSRTHPPTLEEMQRLVDQRSFTDIKLSDPRWMATFHTHYRLVPRYRHGRVFLAGDAAHVQSYIGGQGMNTGIQDAYNLAWRLAMAMRFSAPEWWLDSYDDERRKVAADEVQWTKAATEALTAHAELSSAECERLLEHMTIPESGRLKLRTHQEELDLDYGLSRLCLESAHSIAGPRAGTRVPDVRPIKANDAATSLLKVLSTPRFHLLLFTRSTREGNDPELSQSVQDAAKHYGEWLDVHVVVDAQSPQSAPDVAANLLMDSTGELRRRLVGDRVRLYLIRPDGHIAFRSEHIDRLNGYLSQVQFS